MPQWQANVVVTDAARKRALAAKQYIELYDDKKTVLQDRRRVAPTSCRISGRGAHPTSLLLSWSRMHVSRRFARLVVGHDATIVRVDASAGAAAGLQMRHVTSTCFGMALCSSAQHCRRFIF
jgi:hypothetical protein